MNKQDKKLYAVMGANIEEGYPNSKDTATFQKIVLSDQDLFKHGEAYISAYHKHKDLLEAEQTELNAKKKDFVDPIDQRLKEIKDEINAITSYADTIQDSINNFKGKVPFVAQDGFAYKGTEKPGVYRHLQKIKVNDDETYEVTYCDNEHQLEPERQEETA